MSVVARLLLLFTIMPIIEISLLIPLHNAIGGWATIGIVCATAALGTALTRWQGAAALRRIKDAIRNGQLPGEEIIDGVLVLLSGALLITPGVLTDTTGLLLLIPSLRAPVRRYAMRRLLTWLDAKAFGLGGAAPIVDADDLGGGASAFGAPDGLFGADARHQTIDITPENK
jgi:UPF0716 protein FxsA